MSPNVTTCISIGILGMDQEENLALDDSVKQTVTFSNGNKGLLSQMGHLIRMNIPRQTMQNTSPENGKADSKEEIELDGFDWKKTKRGRSYFLGIERSEAKMLKFIDELHTDNNRYTATLTFRESLITVNSRNTKLFYEQLSLFLLGFINAQLNEMTEKDIEKAVSHFKAVYLEKD